MNSAVKTINCRPPKGIDGRNICVVTLDTGICPCADLPLKRILFFKDFVNGKEQPYDDNGHGTHVAGCLGGNGFLSGGLYRGVAPSCRIISLKTLDEGGNGTAKWTFDAIKWILKNKDIYNIRIVNMSVGTGDKSIYKSLADAAFALWQKGIIVCAASGNNDPSGITSPGINRHIITAGSIEDGRLFRIKENGRAYVKPDIFAPGKDIVSCMADNFSFETAKRRREKIVGTGYVKMSGSSMSTPMVSGAAALILQQKPFLTPNHIKKIIVSSATVINGKKILNIENMFKY